MSCTCLRRLLTPWCPASRGSGYEPASCSRVFTTEILRTIEPRHTSTTDILSQLCSVKNIRDLSEACSQIAPGRIFRSASPIAASPADVQILLDKLQIKQLIDLRSDYERQLDVPLQNGLISQAIVVTKLKERSVVAAQASERANSSLSGTGGLRMNLLSLLERDRYYRAMLTRVPYTKAASVIFWGLFNQSYAKTLAIREINKAGLPGLYEIILATAGSEIREALEVIMESLEQDRPLLFFCKVGKDRTGLLASLVLACCGASSDEIISDYARSDGVDQIALGSMEKDKELKELDTAMFSRAPADVMRSTLQHFEFQYGGIRGYLDQIGFSPAMQNRLALRLSSSDARHGL